MLQNGTNVNISEVFETYTYKRGVVDGRYSFSTALGLFNSLVGFVLIFTSDRLAKLVGEDGIF